MTVVDTSFLIALHEKKDRFFRQAQATELTGDRFLVPWEVWTELCHVLSLHFAPVDAQRVLASITSGPFDVQHVTTPEDSAAIVGSARRINARARTMGLRPFTYFDLVVCRMAQRLREGILTFDDGIIAGVRARLFPGARIA